jgi:hypothetical protein
MMNSFRHDSNSFSTNDSNFLISDLLIPLYKEEKEELEPSITSFCCSFCCSFYCNF